MPFYVSDFILFFFYFPPRSKQIRRQFNCIANIADTVSTCQHNDICHGETSKWNEYAWEAISSNRSNMSAEIRFNSDNMPFIRGHCFIGI